MSGISELYEKLRAKLLERYEKVKAEYTDPVVPVPADLREATESEERPVVLYFTAEWCGPCISFLETLRGVARKYAGRALFYKVNVDENARVADEFRIEYIPAIVVLVKGGVVYKAYGVVSRESLEEKIKRFLEVPS